MKDNIYVTTINPGLMRTGSIGHAEFKGDHKKEYSWFATASSLPLVTVSGEYAARQILKAGKRGQAELIISLPAKLAVQFSNHFPELFSDIMGVVNRVLPKPTLEGSKKLGVDSHSNIAPSFATKLSEDAARRNNEQSI